MEEKKILLPAKLEHLDSMISSILEAARLLGFDEKKINHIQLAAEEVLVNIINYAYPDTDGDIEIILTPLDRGIKVEITDSGKPFNPLSMPDPDINAPLEERRIGGLGIYLVRRLMDEVTYERRDNKNILSFVKKI